VPTLLRIIYNITTGLYEVQENDIMYAMTLGHTVLLKSHYRHNHLVEQWYNELDRATKRQIIRTGNISKDNTDFYPDPEFE
jgi:hypothetical protein